MTTPIQKKNENLYTSPCKMGSGGKYFQEGMRVMFFNIENVDVPAFAIGKLGKRLDPNIPRFDISWEEPMVKPWEEYEEYFNNNPLILHPDRMQSEIKVREAVHEAQLLMYGTRIRQATSIDPRSIETIHEETISDLGLEIVVPNMKILEINEWINECNRDTWVSLQQQAQPKTDQISIPANLYQEAQTRIIEHMKMVNHFKTSMSVFPGLEAHIPEKFRLENVDPLLRWIHQQAEQEEKGEVPAVGVARMPTTTEETTTFPRSGVGKGVPTTINIPDQLAGSQGTEVEVLGEPAATKQQLQLPDVGIRKTLPQCQNIADIAQSIRNSEFGKLGLKPSRPKEPKIIKELTDLEVVIAYSTFLLMIVGRLTTSNIVMDLPQDWYATNMRNRVTFINGFYGAWYNIEKTWDHEDPRKYRAEETENGFVAALGSLRACAIGANDEFFLRALNNGGKIDKKIYYKVVGHPKVKKVDDDVAKIIQEPHEFEVTQNGEGRLYDSIVNFLHNANKLGELRVSTPQVTVNAQDIKHEVSKRSTGGSKRSHSATSTSASPAKRRAYAPRQEYSDSDESYQGSRNESDTEEEEGGEVNQSESKSARSGKA
jgi:hypothetical protein